MEVEILRGYWTYRSFINNPNPVDSFDQIRFGEGELFLNVRQDGNVSGSLSFPAQPGAEFKAFMDITGSVTNWSPITLRFTGTGRKDTDIFDFKYEYFCSLAHTWENGINQRAALVGTIVRSQDHGAGDQVAKAGATASFVAVKRNFVETRDVPGLALLPAARDRMASTHHRLHHTVWHATRNFWLSPLTDADRQKITDLGWGVERSPFNEGRALNLTNGAGEDFLFMHRQMIAEVRSAYEVAGIPPIKSWGRLPLPDAPQFIYVEVPDPEDATKKTWKYSIAGSGFMVPPADANDPAFGDDEAAQASRRFLKSPEFFSAVMPPLETSFGNPRYLAALTLGALGSLIEFTIHNQMHTRWSTISRDPETGAPGVRGDLEFGGKWDGPRSDYLGDFYSSHVHPLFWRLHGWVDDRIEDWFRAHEAANPGEVERVEYGGVAWFKPGKWVQAANPWSGPSELHHHHFDHEEHSGHNEEHAIETMKEVMRIIVEAFARQPEVARVLPSRPNLGITNFLFLNSFNPNL